MADLARIKRNVAKMVSMNAPEADIDGYIASEGVTVDDVRNYGKDYTLGRLGTIDRGITFGLGRKAGGLINAAGSKLADAGIRLGEIVANVQNKGLSGAFDEVEKKPSFMERYHEIVDPTMQAIEQYHEDKPVEAFALEMGAGFANPVNKVGVNYIKDAKNLAGTAVRSGIVGTGVGGVAGAMNTENADNLAVNTLGGAGTGAVIGTALPVAANRAGVWYNGLKKIVAPEASVAGKATGLGNVVKDNESVRALSRGIMASDDVAAQVAKEAPTEMGRLNEELTDILNKTTGRKIDIKQTLANKKQQYADFISNNADKEIMDFMPRDAIQDSVWYRNVVPDNTPVEMTNIEVVPTETDAKSLKQFIAEHLGTTRNQSTPNGEDVLFSNDAINRIIKKNRNPDNNLAYSKLSEIVSKGQSSGIRPTDAGHKASASGQNIYHSGLMYKEQPYAVKFYVDQPLPQYPNGYHVYAGQDITPITKIKQAASDGVLDARAAASPAKQPVYTYNLADLRGNVKENLPNISGLYDGLTPNQTKWLDEAIAKGLGNTNQKAGTLESINEIKKVLNKMINDSQQPNPMNRVTSVDTPDTVALREVKKRVDAVLGEATKTVDRGYAKIKHLEELENIGYKFRPSETKYESLGLKTPLEKRAFLQGRIKAILDNVKDDKNLAKAIRADENTLKRVMSDKNFNELISKTSEIDRKYSRLNKLMQLADREIDKPIAADRPASERTESLTSYLGSLYDKANARLWKNANTRRAFALLNGGAVNPRWAEVLENYGRQHDLSTLTPYWAQYMANHQ